MDKHTTEFIVVGLIILIIVLRVAAKILQHHFSKRAQKQLLKKTMDEDLSEIVEQNLFLSSVLSAQNRLLLKKHNIKTVITLSVAAHNYYPDEFTYHHLPIIDNSSAPINKYFEQAFDLIEQSLTNGQAVLVHCEAGLSRSPTIVLSYLMKKQKVNLRKAFYYLKNRRPIVEPNFGFINKLFQYEQTLELEPSIDFLGEYVLLVFKGLKEMGMTASILSAALQECEYDLSKALVHATKSLQPPSISTSKAKPD
mmetsp:Transcript_17472/g.24248  ORF Transcript_17472/g.24248 Transcript_17472/m.24248 type:complete len:253 (+) Transcript_17472:32-790(+)